MTLTIKLLREVIKGNPSTKCGDHMSNGSAVRVLKGRQTHTHSHTDGSVSITSTTDAGGKNHKREVGSNILIYVYCTHIMYTVYIIHHLIKIETCTCSCLWYFQVPGDWYYSHPDIEITLISRTQGERKSENGKNNHVNCSEQSTLSQLSH